MPTLKRPSARFSFTDWNKTRPMSPPPGDMLDAILADLTEALISTQEALAELRRDDGKLRNDSVGRDQLSVDVVAEITQSFEQKTSLMLGQVREVMERSRVDVNDVALLAKDAEAAAVAANQFASTTQAAEKDIADDVSQAENAADRAEYAATAAENSANYADALSDNAIFAKDEALKWAEFLAGPVVDSTQAPAYIADSAWPHGLFYQPVHGMGGTGGLWSAKWWAVQASMIVGPWAFYYFGPWPAPPSPGNRSPQTGQVIPSPILPGSMYYDTTMKMLMVWDGTQWVPSLQPVAGWKNQFTYVATAGQTDFTGPDVNAQSPVVGTSRSDVHLNGVLLVEGASYDYTINTGTNTLTMLSPMPAGAIVQWALVPAQVAANPVKAFGITFAPAAPDGTTTAFTMSYSGGAVNAANSNTVMISVDGVVQQPGIDYTATGATINFSAAPPANSRLWGTFWSPT